MTVSETVPEITIVVPVFNTAEYLPECLQSLVAATSSVDAEVILVNDGSTDESGAICNEYAARYPTVFKVIHKANGGSASARQAAWDVARGEYITVCDSDDTVEPDMYCSMLQIAAKSNADIVICDFSFFYPDGTRKRISFGLSNPVNADELLNKSLASNIYNSSWNKIFRKSLFTDNKLRWISGINLGEDGLMWTRILTLPNLKIAYVPESFYNYRRRKGENTYTNRITADKWRQLRRVHELRKHLVPENMLLDSASDVVFAGLRISDIPQKELNGFIDENIHPVALWPIRPKRIVAAFAKVFGVGVTRRIVSLLYKFIYR